MIYSYLCRGCGSETQTTTFCRIGELLPRTSCAICGDRLVRAVTRVAVETGLDWDFNPHFNNTVGQPVTSLRDFHEKLQAKAREQTEATGIEHTYVTTDPRDRSAYGISDEAVEMNEAANRGERVDTPRPEVQTDAGMGEAPPLVGEKT